ncbi:hypothetical protein DFQ01_12168 [Paenibacillus cellulosilyticus]|uniref:Uncharacterized protein n=1 Tax=Paenibacillus cellulosilyticus TaxID=375489 RepID=A0A2V2YPY8_9BACL|nr:hypothetical protein [Paenibacillus cellulosilyticus]PWV97424.1 hypothetical protein DFQ01_12168 [Paenibacillus cellulosilyticus]QKS48535.1 hypothetical protein HUB94_30335 [Paenibacillus cellulosilyticus]
MLDDTTRKVLRILFNLNRQQWAQLDMDRLQHLSGRTRLQVEQSLQQLSELLYVEQQCSMVRVVRGWEQPAQMSRRWVD